MRTRSTLVLCLILTGCGGSTSADDDTGVADAGADGTPKTDTANDDARDALLPGDTAVPSDVKCLPMCLDAKIQWGDQGGRVAYVDTSSIAPCRTYEHRRTPTFTDPPDRVCTQDIEACNPAVHGVGDVRSALADADVQTALAKAPVLYGLDTRPSDGSVFVITNAGKEISVGADCGGASGCTPIPAGVAKLAALLHTIDTEQLATGTCKAAFGP
jgi:hypothetical protein